MGDLLRLAEQLARLAEQLDHDLLGAAARLAGEPGVRLAGGIGGEPRGRIEREPAVLPDDGTGGQVELAPPRDVGGVAERADHGDAGALVGLGEVVRPDRDLDAEDRRGDRRVEQVAVALVVGVGDQGDAAHDQLGPGRGDDDVIPAVGAVERDLVVRRRPVAVLHLGLGDRGLVRRVPQGRRVLAVGLAPGEVPQERLLADRLGPVADRRVLEGPVDRQADEPEELLEHLLVLGGEDVAELDEVASADRDEVLALLRRVLGRPEVGIERDRGVARDPVVVLDPALGGQAVVVPAHRVEDVAAAHPLVPGDRVGVGVAEDVADVERARRGRRRRVDRVDVGPVAVAGEPVHAVGLPPLDPAALDAVEGRLVGHGPLGSWPQRSLGVGHGPKVPTPPEPLRTRSPPGGCYIRGQTPDVTTGRPLHPGSDPRCNGRSGKAQAVPPARLAWPA